MPFIKHLYNIPIALAVGIFFAICAVCVNKPIYCVIYVCFGVCAMLIKCAFHVQFIFM